MRHPVDYAPSQNFGENPTSILPLSHWIIQQFGNYQPDGHTGTDYPCPIGTPVRAAADGVVLHVGRLSGSYADNPWWISPSFAGWVYVVDHGHFIGIYGHCMDGGARVRQGQSVIEGQVLGLSGNTGASTGPHLHFEALPDGYVLNSYMYGRINPATLFSGVHPQSTPITPQEDDLTPDESRQLARVFQMVSNLDENHLIQRVINIDNRTAALAETTKYVKGTDDTTLYEINEDTGELRGITLAEWEVTGKDYRTLPQATINRLLGK